MGRTAKHKTRNDTDDTPPSVFASMPTISLLEAVVTKDPRWHWLEAAWDASEDAAVRELAGFVREHRVTLANELAGHVRQVCAQPDSDGVVVDSE
jgi:sugar phosphate isomerase/epimerase